MSYFKFKRIEHYIHSSTYKNFFDFCGYVFFFLVNFCGQIFFITRKPVVRNKNKY
jgi:hypothetical protein